MFKISREDRKMLLDYMARRPYAEVFQLIAMLVGLKPDANSKDKDKNEAIQLLTNFAMDFSKDLGYKYIYENPSYELIKKL